MKFFRLINLNLFLIIFLIVTNPQSGLAQVDSGYINSDRGEIFYRSAGTGQPIIFLNGGPGVSSAPYQDIFTKLNGLGKVVLFDQRGTGRSRGFKLNKKTISIEQMVEDLEKLRQHLGYEKIDLIGQSFGGTYALAYLAKYPQHVDHMVVISSSGLGKETAWRFREYSEGKNSYLSPERLESMQRMLDKYRKEHELPSMVDAKSAYRSRARSYVHHDRNLPAAIHWLGTLHKYDQPTVRKLLIQSLRKTNLKEALATVKNNVLILHGQADFIDVRVARQTKDILQNSTLIVLEESGHMMWLDQPDKVQGAIRDFLSTQ